MELRKYAGVNKWISNLIVENWIYKLLTCTQLQVIKYQDIKFLLRLEFKFGHITDAGVKNWISTLIVENWIYNVFTIDL